MLFIILIVETCYKQTFFSQKLDNEFMFISVKKIYFIASNLIFENDVSVMSNSNGCEIYPNPLTS